MDKLSVNLGLTSTFMVAFTGLLAALLYLALWRPRRIRSRASYRWA